jgi:two-component system LytT family response regulator
MSDLQCIIIDDEPLARKGIEKLVSEVPFLKLIACCSDTRQAKETIEKNTVDLIFLDIEMPDMNGMQFLKSLSASPAAIITTAFPQYALESYELNVIDYLVKPISFERLLKAVKKAGDFISVKTEKNKSNEDYFFIKCEHRYEKVYFNEILFVQGLQNYVIIQTTQKRHITYLTLKNVSEYLPSSNFAKVNKSYIVSIAKIDVISGNEVFIKDYSFSIGPNHKDEIMNAVLKNKVLIRKS